MDNTWASVGRSWDEALCLLCQVSKVVDATVTETTKGDLPGLPILVDVLLRLELCGSHRRSEVRQKTKHNLSLRIESFQTRIIVLGDLSMLGGWR